MKSILTLVLQARNIQGAPNHALAVGPGNNGSLNFTLVTCCIIVGLRQPTSMAAFVNKFLMKKGVLGEVFGDILLLKRLDEFEERSPLFGFFYISDR